MKDTATLEVAPRLADHRTPFICNEWYIAALSRDVSSTPIARTLLQRSILLYRQKDGTPVALRDRCPHRSYPLSKSPLNDDDTITCGYHGLTFAPDGRCVAVPSQESVPASLRAKTYPLVDRPPFLWIWMGDADLADPADIPEHPWLSSVDYAASSGYLRCKASYVRLHENVLDLTHFPYVHGAAIGGLDYISVPSKVEVHDSSVCIVRRLEDRPVNEDYGRLIGNSGNRVNRSSESWFLTPAFHIAHAKIEDLEGGVDGRSDFHIKLIHGFTPETPHSCHYYFAIARDFRVDNEELTRVAADKFRSTFLEDDAVLELVEMRWKEEDNSDYEELSVRGDRAGLQMRRIIAQRAEAEAQSPVPRRPVHSMPQAASASDQ